MSAKKREEQRDGKTLKLLHTWRQSRRIHACVRIYSAGTLSAAFKKRTPGLTADLGGGNRRRISLELDDPPAMPLNVTFPFSVHITLLCVVRHKC